MTTFTKFLKLAPMLLCAYASSASALVINFNHAPGMNAQALAGFQSAANRWTNALRDDVQVNLDIDFAVLAPGVLGGTGATNDFYLYSDVRNALIADARGVNDQKAVASLNAGPCMSIYMNGTSTNPNGNGSGASWVGSPGTELEFAL